MASTGLWQYPPAAQARHTSSQGTSFRISARLSSVSSTSLWHFRHMVFYRSRNTTTVPSPSGRPPSLSPQFCSDSHLVKKFAATVQFSRVLFFLTLSSRTLKWRFVQCRFSFVPHGTVALSPETYTKVCKWCASKAITEESDVSDSSSSTVLIVSYKSTAAVPESGTRS